MPCCSEIAPVAGETILPGQSFSISVVLKIRTNELERKRVEFVVETDSQYQPAMKYALLASICPEWEMHPVGEQTRELPVGRSARNVIRIVSRRVAREGGTLPAHVDADVPLAARFICEPTERTGAEGVTTSLVTSS